ncbi:MAG TPA: hypothetical protein VH437_07815 [Terriglobales bacterium]
MVKKAFCVVVLIACLVPASLLAQKNASISHSGLGGSNSNNVNVFTPPPYCSPCLFYGGDWDPNSSWVAYANWNTVALGQATVYVPFTVPTGEVWTIDNMFTNNLAINFDNIDPKKADWSINSGISEGNPGTVIASGNANARFVATGRNYQNTYFEYTAQVKLSPRPQLQAGTYWFSVVPNCTNGADANCSSVAYYINDTIGGANHFGPLEPNNKTFHNAPGFGLNYTNVCNEGYPPPACSRMSGGLGGKRAHAN